MWTLILALSITGIAVGAVLACVGLNDNNSYAYGIILFVIASCIVVLSSTVYKIDSYTTIVDRVMVSKTDNGWTMVSKDNMALTSNSALIYLAPNSNIVIQANAGYNAWKKAKTNSYEIVVK